MKNVVSLPHWGVLLQGTHPFSCCHYSVRHPDLQKCVKMHQKRPAQKLKCLSRIYYAFAALCCLSIEVSIGAIFHSMEFADTEKVIECWCLFGFCRDHKRCAEHCWWVALCKNKTIKSLRGNLPTKCKIGRLPTKVPKRFNQANLHSPIVFRLGKPYRKKYNFYSN